MRNCFRAPRLFLPRGGFEKWAVPAADSHPDDGKFWERVARKVGSAPSSLSCILPDVHREENEEKTAQAAVSAMHRYLTYEKFDRVGRGFILTERKLKSGLVRTGIVAALDLEHYSYARGEISYARATEAPSPRVKQLLALRRKALLEFPHTLLFYKDKNCDLIDGLNGFDLEILYNFSLMEEGGSIRGSYIPEEYTREIAGEMFSRGEPSFAVADGHDELAAAKMYWEEIKPTLHGNELKNHPARFALVECINLYDPSVQLLPVHRLVSGEDIEAFADYFSKNIRCKRVGNLLYPDRPADAENVQRADEIIAAYLHANGGSVKYMENAASLSEEGIGVVFKAMKKDDLFYGLKSGQLMPPHTFTVGEENKRYSLEGREISYD